MLKVLINIVYFILYRLKKSPSIGEVIADIVYSDRYDDINKIYHHISKIFCMKYKLSHVPKLIIEDMDTCIDGQYDHNTCKIYLNKHNVSLDSIMGKTAVCLTILHEYRHHWQYHNLKEEYMWWINHKGIYSKLYNVCPIEIDANRFSRSIGEDDDKIIFESLPLKLFKNYYNSKDLDEEIEAEYALRKAICILNSDLNK